MPTLLSQGGCRAADDEGSVRVQHDSLCERKRRRDGPNECEQGLENRSVEAMDMNRASARLSGERPIGGRSVTPKNVNVDGENGMPSPPSLPRINPQQSLATIGARDSTHVTREKQNARNSFDWPLRTPAELRRLLQHPVIAPTHLCGCEFTGAMRRAWEAEGFTALSVDTREALDGGMHYCGDLQDVLESDHVWTIAFFWPPCTHQTKSDTTGRSSKSADGRTFWGIAFYIYVLSRTRAALVVVEQPDTWIPLYYQPDLRGAQRQRVRPSFFGDPERKAINLTLSGGPLVVPYTDQMAAGDRLGFYDFKDAEERDRWRSSWARFPELCRALAQQLRPDGTRGEWSYAEEIEIFALAWHRAGLAVPADYANPRGGPSEPEGREYQKVRGRGDGRRVTGVIPKLAKISPAVAHPPVMDATRPALDSLSTTRHPSTEVVRSTPDLPTEQSWLTLSQLSATCTCVVLVADLQIPLVYADLLGLRVLGFDLGVAAIKGASLRVAQQAAISLLGYPAVTLLAGRYLQGPAVVTVPTAVPLRTPVVSSAAHRRRLIALGVSVGWCALSLLATDPIYPICTRAATAAAMLVHPVSALADGVIGAEAKAWGDFLIGRAPARPLGRGPALSPDPDRTTADILQRAARGGQALINALLQHDADAGGYLAAWAERIQPPPLAEIPADLLAHLPTFGDSRLGEIPFPAIVPPLQTEWWSRLPTQPPPDERPCPQNPFDLYEPAARSRVRRKVEHWLKAAEDDLKCIHQLGPECVRMRPRAIAIGSSGMYSWAKNRVWDFTRERDPSCGIPLDYALPLESHLDLDYLRQRLGTFPDQRLVAYLLEGVRMEAYVELQSVWVPHLLSLSDGYDSVRKELARLQARGWYRTFDHFPFWPCYINGQGATARKLEPWRFRRTTEGGGPRTETRDENGLLALPINNASKRYLFPSHLLNDPRPQMHQWAHERLLYADQQRPPLWRHSKWPAEIKPTLEEVMRILTVLNRAARVLDEPIYVFSDDGADWFNQLALASQTWPLFNVVFLDPDGTKLQFISERRLGFGCHPASKIAQRFSDALLFLFRQDMDQEEAQAIDLNPRLSEWMRTRARVAARHGTSIAAEQRLYAAVMYSDDPLIAVVGVERAVRALKVWRHLTQRTGLIMSIPEKRLLGIWAKWLGVLIVAGLGLVVVPRDKLLRAAEMLRNAIAGNLDFGQYRSLVGLLEHLRSVNRAGRNCMYHLYEPHKRDGALQLGPSAPVHPSGAMKSQLQRWVHLVNRSGGTAVTSSIRASHMRGESAPIFVTSADACTDGGSDDETPGLGGFFHGFFWYLPLPASALGALHITALELLATGINALVFSEHLCSREHVILLSDALATPYTLQSGARSPVLMYIHLLLLAQPRYLRVAAVAECGHLFGDANVASDLASRGKLEELRALCAQLGVRMQEITVPEEALELLDNTIHRFQAERSPPLPFAEERALTPTEGRRTSAYSEQMEGDGPSTAERLRQAALQPSTAERLRQAASQLSNAGREAENMLSALNPARAAPAGSHSGCAQRSNPPTPSPERIITTAGAPGLPLAAPTGTLRSGTKRAGQPLLGAASKVQVQRKAERWTDSPFFANATDQQLGDLLRLTSSVAEFGAATATLQKDELAWRHWLAYAEALGFDPHLREEHTISRLSEVGVLLAGYLLFIYPRMKGKHGRRWAKPGSAFQYVLALLRCFKRWDIPMPSARTVKLRVRGLMRAFCEAYGPLALAATRKEPMKYSMITTMLELPNGSTIGSLRWDDTDPYVRHTRCLMLILWRTALRLGDLINPEAFAVRADVTWRLSGVEVSSPTVAQLQNLRPGDVARISCGRTKPDAFGEVHAPFACVLPYRKERHNAAAALASLEIAQPCAGSARGHTPLFVDAQGALVSHRHLDRILDALLATCFDSAVAATHSWHSFRIGLACALHAADASDAVIQLACRWLSPDSLRLYRRLGTAEVIRWVDAAEKVHVDTIQQGNVVTVENSEAFGALLQHVGDGTHASRVQQLNSHIAPADATPAQHPADRSDAASTGEANNEDSPDESPLIADNCVGRRVLVPSTIWPTYSCNELGGAGWSARIVARTRHGVRVTFLQERDSRGRRYRDAELSLTALRPL